MWPRALAFAASLLTAAALCPASGQGAGATDGASSQAGAASPASVEPAGLTPKLLTGLRQGGYLIFFRHALTPNYADPDDSQLDNCATQRNLSKDGIEQARALGEAFRDLEIPLGIVRASPMCRTMDTAWLAFGRFERDMGLRMKGKNPDQDAEETKTWRNLRNLAKLLPLPGTNSVFVSHGTVGEVFGAGYLEEGEAVIVRPDGLGGWRLVARIKAGEWKSP